tara:strand:+ start:3071 stop:3580 length:510 start_codon:yes stop_codon:yes gene_type:complete
MEIEKVKTDVLIPYVRNARTHSDEQVAQICGSIKEFGFTNPVLIDSEKVIIAGHGRVMAAQRMGLSEVPCITLDYLTEAQKKAFIIADNKLALNAGWDEELLKVELKELKDIDFNVELTGFSLEEITDIFFEPEFEIGSEDEQGGLDNQTRCKCPKCDFIFDPVEHKIA